MSLRGAILWTLFRTELRMLFRDRRVLIMSIGIPLVILPLMLFGSRATMKQREKTLEQMTCRYVVSGPRAEEARQLVAATLERIHREPATTNNPPFAAEELQLSDPEAALERNEIHVIVMGLDLKDSAQTNSIESKTRSGPAPDSLLIRLVGRGDRDDSMTCVRRVTDALEETRSRMREELLDSAGFQVSPGQVARVHEENLATKGQVAGLALGRVMTVFLLLFILTGGSIAAIDSLAGEKERGTLETLLTTGASRMEIIVAKHLTVLALALLITVVQSANLLVYIGFKLVPVPGNFAAAITPFTAAFLLVLYLPLAALAASVLLLISGRAKTYKEAQLYFLPVFLLGLAPAMAPFLPGLPLESAIVIVPVAGLAVAARDVLVGSFNWPMIALAWASTAGAAALSARLGIRHLSSERLVTAADTDAADFLGGPALFRRHVWAWFAMLWAVLLIINNYFTETDIRLQLLINLVGIFFAGSVLMIRKYKLDVREALALRAPHPAIWVAVLLAAPGGILTATGAFKLAELIIPVPPEVLDAFSQQVVPGEIPFVQLLFFLAVMPGIFEEITFRGVLLYGLRDRFHPAVLALVVGMVFGIFHVALFRFVPTAVLGIMLAAVTLLSGSIFPAMLWHALSNGLAVMAGRYEVPISELEPAAYLSGVLVLSAAFWIIWRNRTPYPGLRFTRCRRETLAEPHGL
jgi:sodium transport system permease protein